MRQRKNKSKISLKEIDFKVCICCCINLSVSMSVLPLWLFILKFLTNSFCTENIDLVFANEWIWDQIFQYELFLQSHYSINTLQYTKINRNKLFRLEPVADPGFTQTAGANPKAGTPILRWRRQPIFWLNCPQKLHENKENGSQGDARSLYPLESALGLG